MKKAALLAAGVMVLALAACGSKTQAPKSKTMTMKPAAPAMTMPAPKASTVMKAPKAMTKMAKKASSKSSSGSMG
jgi:uncharacterized protein YcfL